VPVYDSEVAALRRVGLFFRSSKVELTNTQKVWVADGIIMIRANNQSTGMNGHPAMSQPIPGYKELRLRAIGVDKSPYHH